MSYTVEEIAWSAKLEYLANKAKGEKGLVFNNLGHLINQDSLLHCFQRLNGMKAIGIDGVTKEEYGRNKDENLERLLKRIRARSYKPQPSRIVEIPKDDGSSRPLAISCFEDKIVQLAVAQILTIIFEPLFYDCSYCFRSGKNAHQALRAMNKTAYRVKNGSVVEIDLKQYFNTIPHDSLMSFLQRKISDRNFLDLIEKLIKAPVVCENKETANLVGAPQGSILSPVLANIYLHYVIDEWFAAINKSHFAGRAYEIRYADDLVFFFEDTKSAERFRKVLPKRLEKYGLQLNESKSQLLGSGTYAAQRSAKRGEKLGKYHFLGFICYWGLSRSQKFWRLKFKSRADRMRKTLQRIKGYLRENLATMWTKSTQGDVVAGFIRMVRGWVNYHAISDNNRRVNAFLLHSQKLLLRWFNRRGSQKMNWKKMTDMLKLNNFPQTYKVTSMW